MKKTIILFLLIFLLVFTIGCNDEGNDEQDKPEDKIFNVLKNNQANGLSYKCELKNTKKNITLTNTGDITKKDSNYEFNYSFQYLNAIDSDSDELITTVTDTVTGNKDEIINSLQNISYSTATLSFEGLSISKNSLKNCTVSQVGDYNLLKGELDADYLNLIDNNLKTSTKYECSIYVNSDFSRVNRLVISYKTENFDSVIITINYR